MKRVTAYLLGYLLIGLGMLGLMDQFDLLQRWQDLIATLIFLSSGVGFLALFVMDREDWWTAMPGFALVGLGSITALQVFGSDPGTWSGAVFLGVLSLGFWAVFLRRREMWWPIIPGGTLLALAGTVAAVALGYDDQSGGVFLGGLALTFGLVYLLRLPRRDTLWALIPAAILALLAIPASTNGEWGNNFLPPITAIFMIVAGAWLLLRGRLSRQA
jgi:hypothetical protein